MSNIIRIDKPDEIVSAIKKFVPSFIQSDEYRKLDVQEQHVTGLVCAAFAKFWSELARLEDRNESQILNACSEIVELLSLSNNAEVQNYVVTEILENLSENECVMARLRAMMGESTTRLFSRWLE